MIMRFGIMRFSKLGLSFSLLVLASCSRAPSFDVLGSFFPAWLLCLGLALPLTLATRWLLLRVHVVLAFPILTYPSLTALFTFALWLAFFQ
jgi:YtcA-like protein